MRRMLLATAMLLIMLPHTGCGDHEHVPTVFVSQILSDPLYDGDIELSSGVLTITQGNTQSVFAGVDPFTLSEFRAFLDFPLTGSGGVPGNAVILSATLDIVIDSVQLSGNTVPILIDLVAFQPPTLRDSDFDRSVLLPLATVSITPPISGGDAGHHVTVDVTPLMTEAQRLGLVDFQVRILEDFNAAAGLVEIDDTTGPDRASFAPLLTVTYE